MAYQTGDDGIGTGSEVPHRQSRLESEGLDVDDLSLLGHVVDVAVRHVRMYERHQRLIDAAVERGYIEAAPQAELSHGNRSSLVYHVTDKGYEFLRNAVDSSKSD